MIDRGDYDHDYKSDLQELVQKHGEASIHYEVTRDEGPDHDKTIWIEIKINEIPMGQGCGKSKKDAAQQAAREAIEKFRTERSFS